MASGDITPGFLSDSTNGRGIKVAATATPGTDLHTAVAGEDYIDVVTLVAVNNDTSSHVLTIEFGGVTDPDDLIEVTIGPQRGLVVVLDRMRINNGLDIAAFADAADVITIFGEVNTIEL